MKLLTGQIPLGNRTDNKEKRKSVFSAGFKLKVTAEEYNICSNLIQTLNLKDFEEMIVFKMRPLVLNLGEEMQGIVFESHCTRDFTVSRSACSKFCQLDCRLETGSISVWDLSPRLCAMKPPPLLHRQINAKQELSYNISLFQDSTVDRQEGVISRKNVCLFANQTTFTLDNGIS